MTQSKTHTSQTLPLSADARALRREEVLARRRARRAKSQAVIIIRQAGERRAARETPSQRPPSEQ